MQEELGLNMYDYGARNYDPIIGRWMNMDALSEKYSSLSPYNYVLNSPLLFIDPDGMRVDYADKESKKAYKEFKRAYKKTEEGRERLKDLKRMEKAKDVTFMININSKKDIGNKDGTTDLNVEKSTEKNVVIDILATDAKEGTIEKDKRVILADELEHGRQFLDGELGFTVGTDGTTQTLGYDRNDEFNSQQASIDASNALGIALNSMQDAIVKDKDAFISKYYDLNSQYRKQNLNSKGNSTTEQLQGYVNTGKANKFVYREESKNVIIK